MWLRHQTQLVKAHLTWQEGRSCIGLPASFSANLTPFPINRRNIPLLRLWVSRVADRNQTEAQRCSRTRWAANAW